MTWANLVSYLVAAKDTMFDAALRLFSYFVTPFRDLVDQAAQDSWIAEVFQEVLDLFDLDLMDMTPLQFMLGSTVPLIIVFTIYRYIKQ